MDQVPPVTIELIRRAQAGDEEARNDLFVRYQPRIQEMIRKRMGRHLRAKMESCDILQEVMLAIAKDLRQFSVEGQGAFMQWVKRLAENEIKDHIKYLNAKKRHGQEISLEPEGTESGDQGIQLVAQDPTPSRELIRREKEERFKQILDMLPVDYREVLIKRWEKELSFREIGEHMGRSEDAARKLYDRAEKALISVIRDQGLSRERDG